MDYKEEKIDFALNKITSNDWLFSGNYTIDPYQNCEFGCNYCDSSFDKTIKIKRNIEEILESELKKEKKGTIIIGSVHDPYQKAEKKYKITRAILKIIENYGSSCHILTKSNLVLRDIDIISKIKDAKVTISIISLKDPILKIFEKNVPSSFKRLKTVKKLNDCGIKSGIALMPILPYVSDNDFKEIIKSAKDHNASYFLHKHLELKGDQKKFYFEIIKNSFPNTLSKYKKLYNDSYMPREEYIKKINNEILRLCKNFEIKNKI